MKLPVDYNKLEPAEKRAVREQYIVEQGGNCCYCGCPLSKPPREDVAMKKINKRLFPRNFFNWPIHLHHDHETGMTIGAIHCICNAVSWQYEGK